MARKKANPYEKQVELQRAVPKIPNADNPAPCRRGKKGMTVYLDPQDHRMLKQLALDEGTNVNALLLKSVNLVLAKYGKIPPT